MAEYNEIQSLRFRSKDFDKTYESFRDQTSRQNPAGGYYVPVVDQPTENTLQFSWMASGEGMPAVPPAVVELPGGGNDSGQNGGIYIGSGEMPEGYNVQIDPTAEAELPATQEWVTAQINQVEETIPSITGLAAETWVTAQIQAAINETWEASY